MTDPGIRDGSGTSTDNGRADPSGSLARITHRDHPLQAASVELGHLLAGLFEDVDEGVRSPQLRALARHLPLIIWEVSADGMIVTCFGEGMRRLGLSDGDLDGTPIAAWGEEGEERTRRALAGEAVEWGSDGVWEGRPWAMTNIVVPRPEGGAVAVSIDVTDRHLVERELSASEERFRSLAEQAPIGIFLADADGANEYTNPELQAQLGRPLVETLGMEWLRAVHVEDRPIIEERRQGARQAGERYDVSYRVTRPEGEERWLRVKAHRLFTDDDKHVGYVGTTQDITDERADEFALLASEQRFRTIAEAAPIGIFLSDAVTDVTFTNPRFSEILGIDSADLAGDGWVASVHRDDLDRVAAAVTKMAVDGTVLDARFRIWPRGDETAWVHAHAVPLFSDDGEVMGSVGTLTDITASVEAERQLRESEELTRAILQTAAEGIVTFDQHGQILTFNAAAERIFGWSAEAVIGRMLDDLLPEPHREVYAGYLRTYRETGVTTLSGSAPRELPALRQDGSTVPVELAVTEVLSHGRTVFTGLVRDISERKEFERQLEHQATHDPLTSLPNRALLAAQLEGALARAYRNSTSVAVLFVSLDRIKVVTDSLGHRAGDELRVAAAHRLQGVVRPADTVTRFGEDEFVVLAEDLDDVSDAVDIAQRVSEAMDMPFDLTIDEAFISCAVGIAFALDGLGTAESLIGDADLAMFRAKEKGGTRFEIFDTGMRNWINERRKTEVSLRHALERTEFELHYQPIVRVDTSAVKGFEALVRWNRAGHGLVPPGAFIPVAEDSGLIVPIGEWIIEEACRQLAAFQSERPDDDLTVSVNLSGRQLAHRSIADTVSRALADAGAVASGLVIEITETVLLDDVDQAVRTLGALKEIGVTLSIDDFGTGYSSLTYLRRFPIDTVKIDRSFVSMLGTDARDASIVNTVILLAEGLNLDVVAEGVETREQLAALAEMNCQYAQGFLFSKPKPVSELVGIFD